MITIKLLLILSLAWGAFGQSRYTKLSANGGYGYAQQQQQPTMPPPPRQTVPTPLKVVQSYGYSQQTTMPPPPPPRQTLPPQQQVVQSYGYSQQTTMPPPPRQTVPPPPRQTVPPQPQVVQSYGYSQQTTMPPPPRQTLPPQQQVVQSYGYSQQTTMPPPPRQTVPPQPQQEVQGYDYSNQMNEQMDRPQMGIPRDAPMFQNPCTEEVMSTNQITLFKDPSDRSSYLICESVNRFHRMPCPSGTLFDESRRQCIPEGFESNACESLCKNDADCVVDELNNARCACKPGFTGSFCETNVDECALGGNQACAGGQCFDQINGYYCGCANGRIGLNCQQTMENPCTPDNVERGSFIFEVPSSQSNVWLQCIGEMQFVVSRCAENLFWNMELQTCTVERPATESGVCRNLPCKNGGDCQDLGNSQFQCLCRDGFSGELCENVDDLCLSNPCSNGGRCLSWPGGFTCVCQNKIIDETCTSGLTNPCPSRSNLIPGFNDYFSHPSPNRYFHCDIDGRAFARSCMTGLRWKQEALSCLPESFVLGSTVPKSAPFPVIKTKPNPPRMQPNFQTNTVPKMAPQSGSGLGSSSGSGYSGYSQERVFVVPEQVLVTVPPTTMPTTTVMSNSYGYSQETREEVVEAPSEEQSLESEELEDQLEVVPDQLERVPQFSKDLLNTQQNTQQNFQQTVPKMTLQTNMQTVNQVAPQMNQQKFLNDQLNNFMTERMNGQTQVNQQQQQPSQLNNFMTERMNGQTQVNQQQQPSQLNKQLSQDQTSFNLQRPATQQFLNSDLFNSNQQINTQRLNMQPLNQQFLNNDQLNTKQQTNLNLPTMSVQTSQQSIHKPQFVSQDQLGFNNQFNNQNFVQQQARFNGQLDQQVTNQQRALPNTQQMLNRNIMPGTTGRSDSSQLLRNRARAQF